MSARGLHKLAGAASKLRIDAINGRTECLICSSPSVAYTEAVGGIGSLVKPLCEAHAEQGASLGYTIHRANQCPGDRRCLEGRCDWPACTSALDGAE